ncbi:MAG: hypothetical protein H8D97_00565 [Proteobacteria bacterium]|nr:hypothetical protein [Pseudomonadota bacterium]
MLNNLTKEEEDQIWEHNFKLEQEYYEQKEWMEYLESTREEINEYYG